MIAARPHHSFEDYVRIEADSRVKHEFVNHEIIAMAGGTVEHGRLAANMIAVLRGRLRGRDRAVLSSDVRVGHATSDFRAYPDATIVCGEAVYAERPAHTVTNPVCVVEVLSESTAAYDRGPKLDGYRSMEHVRVVVLVSQESRHVTVHRRGDDGFEADDYFSGDALQLLDLDAIPVDEIYA